MALDYPTASISELTTAYRNHEVSPVDVMRATLQQVQNRNPELNALFALDAQRGLEEAARSEERWRKNTPLGLLDGVPITVKDSIKMAGTPYWRGCKANVGTPNSSEDAPPAARLKEAGAIIFAKTTQPDLGMLTSGVSSAHGIIRNAWDTQCSPGGSSAGAGASVAAGITAGSVGTDLAGSVRIPAAQNGLFGIKPTAGRIPHLPADAQRCAGPLTRSVADGAILFDVISKPDRRDHISLPPTSMAMPDPAKQDLTGLRIGLLLDMGFGPAPDQQTAMLITKAAEAIEQAGAIVETTAPPFDFDAFAAIDRYFQARCRLEYLSFSQSNRALVLPYVSEWSAQSEGRSAIELMQALAEIERAKAIFTALSTQYDFVLSPVLPIISFPADALGPDEDNPTAHLSFTCLMNQTGQPAATICCGFSQTGMPVGLQIIGQRYDDAGVFQLASTYEAIRNFDIAWPVE